MNWYDLLEGALSGGLPAASPGAEYWGWWHPNQTHYLLTCIFQLTKHEGVVTVSHFARILNHLRLLVADVDFHLLLKKFMKNSYMVNYVAFLEVVDRITRTLTQQQMLDVGGDLIARFPTRALSAELPRLPRPEIGNVALDTVFGPQTIFHPVSRPARHREGLHRVLRRVQQYVWRHRIRVADFFKVRPSRFAVQVTRGCVP